MKKEKKMRVAVCSDVHLEFGPLTLKNEDNADVLVLSGDIMVAADIFGKNDPYGIVELGKQTRFKEFFENCSREFPHVVYIMGNHEHYHGDYAKTPSIIRSFLSEFSNVYFLDKQSISIGNYIFFGGTLWTDFDQGNGPGDEQAMLSIKGMMNDYRGVKNSNKVVSRRVPTYKYDENGQPVYVEKENGYKSLVETGFKFIQETATFSPQDAYDDHNAFLSELTAALERNPDAKFIVCGHHAPSKQSTHPRYKKETLMNTAYSSDLTGFILEHSQIKMWTHGHTHEEFDYMCGNTRIVCNPRGYMDYEQRADDFKLITFEV